MTVNTRYRLLALLVLIFSVSCQNLEKTEKPEDLIPEDKMIDVLTELTLVHAARNFNREKLEKTGLIPDQYIYNKFDIDSLQFQRSTEYYSEQYSTYETMYDSVKNRIQRMKTRLDSIREIEVRIEDSIRQAKKDSIRSRDSLGIKKDSVNVDLEIYEDTRPDSLVLPPSSLKDN